MGLREAHGGVRGQLVVPVGARGRAGVVVAAGSSGRLDLGRAQLLSQRGAAALAIGYFGSPGEPAEICEVPLETFTRAVDVVTRHSSGPVAILGTSKGAEAALSVACRDERVDVVVAFAPTAVVWQSLGGGTGPRSSWAWRGRPLPFVPYAEGWERTTDPPAYRHLYEESLRRAPAAAAAAAIPVARSRAHLVLVAGTDDQVWPSARFAGELAHRAGRDVTLLIEEGAGHRVPLPGEPPPADDGTMARGGTPAADAALGRRAWPAILDALRL